MVIGPLDKRAIRTRCQACSRRRIKCEGGSPCSYCLKKKVTCIPPPAPKIAGVVFVNDNCSTSSSSKLPSEASEQAVIISKSMPQPESTNFISYFFTVFIVRNDFSGGRLDRDGIVANFQSSPSLYHAAMAVGALNASKDKFAPARESRAATVAALSSYKTSLVSFQDEIRDRDIGTNDAALWTTLFLGLFELMHDMSGEGWVKHILFGTSRMLQLRGPEAHLAGRGRSFFLTVRIFEISRAIALDEPTFLNEKPWVELMGKMWLEDISDWHPKEKMYDLMLEIHALGEKVWEVVRDDIEIAPDLLTEAIIALGREGLVLRLAINDWHNSFILCSRSVETDSWSLLAMIYYHAISIYLTGLFDYRPQFNAIPYPTLSRGTMQSHASSIISFTKLALTTTNLAGVLLVFPLRIAGARAVSQGQKREIMWMLNEISTRSFVVAEPFKIDLKNLWESEGSESLHLNDVHPPGSTDGSIQPLNKSAEVYVACHRSSSQPPTIPPVSTSRLISSLIAPSTPLLSPRCIPLGSYPNLILALSILQLILLSKLFTSYVLTLALFWPILNKK
ncbi:uncharacterized protein RCO7_09046 [Rhynchosporium graminicola]|uniref:Zn(2)-C6 fungal-type domain-containing protein n=1 Tax=Rhynchosporium graminicola TaxID=2792576 RepID=A0A1E1LPB3_9HELO|nr:uncharacterized protein RCO7_09046 [Rhynchosporium commune]